MSYGELILGPPTRGRDCPTSLKKKPVVAIFDSGKWEVFPSISAAGKGVGVKWQNVRNCCMANAFRHTNTDHRYRGIRFYFEDNNIWLQKIIRRK